MDDRTLEILFWTFMGLGSVFVVFCFVMGIRDAKKNIAKHGRMLVVPEQSESVFKTITTRATVIDQTCRVKTVGMQLPKTVREFSVVFRMEDGEILKLTIPEMMYDGFQLGQSGTLTVVDGALYSFEPTE